MRLLKRNVRLHFDPTQLGLGRYFAKECINVDIYKIIGKNLRVFEKVMKSYKIFEKFENNLLDI